MHRLVAYAPNGVRRFAVDRSELLIGSSEACHVRLPYAGVGNEHARLTLDGEVVRIEDLGARKGVVINGRKVREARLEVLDEIRLGSIALLLEEVAPVEEPAEPPRVEASPPVIDAKGMLDHLARISKWVLADSKSSTPLESLVVAMLKDFGGGVLFLFQGDDNRGIKFVAASEARWLGHGQEILDQVERVFDGKKTLASSFFGHLDGQESWIAWRPIRALDRPYLFTVALPRFREEGWSPVSAFATLADQLILGLVHHVGQYEPIIFGSRRQTSDLTLVPELIVGESPAMQWAIEQLRTAVDPPIHVLLRGEPGVSKELLARSLHISGPDRDGPFIVATCRGAKTHQIEAELFGAEIQGKRGLMVREGKLREADGGTLFLESVELLPLSLQDRLVHFIRSGEVRPAESLSSYCVKVRLIVASEGPLETFVGRDLFRVDLAYRLSELAIDVPSLRQRREDLPLLIQGAVNRFCHDANKRVQGITVKALEALAVYDYPGNLPELENIVRRLVYLCPQGQPINEAMLPEEVQLAKVTQRPETRSDLNLERLVNDTERAAIREALQRSRGNKSEAARLLALSRNGLAMKMNRLGLTT